MKLKVNDFSVDDKVKAEKMMKEYKLKIQLKQTMMKEHTHIDLLQGHAGIRSIKESPARMGADIIECAISRPASKQDEDSNSIT